MFGDRDKQRNDKAATAASPAAAAKGSTLIAANTRIEGDVHFSDQLQIQGQVKGNLLAEPDTDARVEISEQGTVFGDIRVPRVVVNGRVKGDIHAGHQLELAANARVQGDVHYQMIQMEMGARVDGNLVYAPEGDGSRVESTARPSEAGAAALASESAADAQESQKAAG